MKISSFEIYIIARGADYKYCLPVQAARCGKFALRKGEAIMLSTWYDSFIKAG